MPTRIEDELGLGPTLYRLRRWLRRILRRLGAQGLPDDRRLLDPLTVNYEAWLAMRRSVRSWPQYKEAPNGIEVFVSPEDWDDYWGIDTERKQASVAAYVQARAVDKGYWMAGKPRVTVAADEGVEIGEVEVECQFVELLSDEQEQLDAPDFAPTAGSTSSIRAKESAAADIAAPMRVAPSFMGGKDETTALDRQDPGTCVPPTMRYVDAQNAGSACLVGENGFRLSIRSGDCIGAVRVGELVAPEVNVRLDAEGFPYVEACQCTLGIVDGRWTVTNHASRGTQLLTRDGSRLMLGEPEPYPINEGDVIWLGPRRPLRFELER